MRIAGKILGLVAALLAPLAAPACYYEDTPNLCPAGYCVATHDHGVPCKGPETCWKQKSDHPSTGVDGAPYGYDTWVVQCMLHQKQLGAPVVMSTETPQAPPAVETKSDTEKKIKETAEKSGGSQQVSLLDAKNVFAAGGDHFANLAAVDCADAANQAAKQSEFAEAGTASCRNSVAKAAALKEAELKSAQRADAAGNGAFRREEDVLSSPGARAAFAAYEKNFGITREDFLERFLALRGNPAALDDLLKGKAAAVAVKAEAEASPGAEPRKGPDLARIRASFSRRLGDSSEGYRDTDPLAQPDRDNRLNGLEPLSGGILGTQNETDKELSLFDIVHRKYKEIRRRRGF